MILRQLESPTTALNNSTKEFTMSFLSTFSFAKNLKKPSDLLICLVDSSLKLTQTDFEGSKELQAKIDLTSKIAEFEGKAGQSLDVLAPTVDYKRVMVFGLPDSDGENKQKMRDFGGSIGAKLDGKAATIILGNLTKQDAVDVVKGLYLNSYRFEAHKTVTKKRTEKLGKITLIHTDASDLKEIWINSQAVADGTLFARELVNEPANFLTTTEFAKRAKELSALGVDVKILEEKQLKTIGMHALLAVGQGSTSPSKVVVMEWNGGSKKEQPVAFVGKGVVFDSGGISIKPAASMEDMKGDMGGAAAVCGLMKAVAGRKAKTNIVGIIGLVENMPDGNAQRPGDVVSSLSGQTIEVINTDAEGRMVLADLLWYCEDKFKPKAMINLATLTGAVIVALGFQNAGMFTNSDELSAALTSAGLDTCEPVWRMPLSKSYDKLIESKFADMKNTGGRWAGSITAAQFLQRFVRDCDWAHLDVAGVAMNSPQNDINRSWGSGFGVELLNKYLETNHEK